MTIGTTQQETAAAALPAPTASDVRLRRTGRLPVRVHTPRSRRELGVIRLRRFLPIVTYIGWLVTTRRMRGTWLGYLWIPLRPALNLLAKGFVFGGMLHVASGSRPYLMFLVVGQGAWDFFDKSVYWSFRTLQSEKKLISSYQIPWIGPIMATVIPAAVDAGQYVVIGIIASIYYRFTRGSFFVEFNMGFLETLFGAVLLAAWAIALSLVLAPVIMKVRDVRFILKYILSFWMYLVPIIYPISYLPDKYQGIAQYNPITAPLEMIKDGILATGHPSKISVASCVLGLMIVLPVGLFMTARAEREAHARI